MTIFGRGYEISWFVKKWISLIMKCVCSVNYLMVINDKSCGNIKPSIGLRQGDPPSPYIFLLCAK